MAPWMDVEALKWRADAEVQEKKIQRAGGVQVVNLGPEITKRAHDGFWAELEKASPQHIPHLKKLMTK